MDAALLEQAERVGRGDAREGKGWPTQGAAATPPLTGTVVCSAAFDAPESAAAWLAHVPRPSCIPAGRAERERDHRYAAPWVPGSSSSYCPVAKLAVAGRPCRLPVGTMQRLRTQLQAVHTCNATARTVGPSAGSSRCRRSIARISFSFCCFSRCLATYVRQRRGAQVKTRDTESHVTLAAPLCHSRCKQSQGGSGASAGLSPWTARGYRAHSARPACRAARPEARRQWLQPSWLSPHSTAVGRSPITETRQKGLPVNCSLQPGTAWRFCSRFKQPTCKRTTDACVYWINAHRAASESTPAALSDGGASGPQQEGAGMPRRVARMGKAK